MRFTPLALAGFLGLATSARAQTTPYLPLQLDSSCVWIYDFRYYDGGFSCDGERTSFVEKDTVIAGRHYAKVVTYTTGYSTSNVPDLCLQFHLNSRSDTRFLREDPVTRTVYEPDGRVALNFAGNVGDSLDLGLMSRNPVVDSVTMTSVAGTPRRTQWATVNKGTNLARVYRIIEGVGANWNFPAGNSFGEWQTPVYNLRCFARAGQLVYTTGAAQPCVRKPAYLAVTRPQAAATVWAVADGGIRITDPSALPVRVELFDGAGRLLHREWIRDQQVVTGLPTASPFRIVRLTGAWGSTAFLLPATR